jgi:hypothetical protein
MLNRLLYPYTELDACVNVNTTHDRRDNRCYGTLTARSEYTHLI